MKLSVDNLFSTEEKYNKNSDEASVAEPIPLVEKTIPKGIWLLKKKKKKNQWYSEWWLWYSEWCLESLNSYCLDFFSIE